MALPSSVTTRPKNSQIPAIWEFLCELFGNSVHFEQTEARFQYAEREQTRQDAKFLDFQQITRSITVDHILRTKDDILPLAKQLMQSVEFHSHPIRLLGLGVSNPGSPPPDGGLGSQRGK